MTRFFFRNALLAGLCQAGSAFFCLAALAQNTSEVGFGFGATNYRGEISPQYRLKNNRPAFTLFYRKDISAPVTLRGGVNIGLLRAADSTYTGTNGGVPPVQGYRNTNMRGSIWEASGVMEYNFLDYHYRKDKVHFTPYLFVGLAAYYANIRTESNNPVLNEQYDGAGGMLGIAVPAGFGLKLALSEFINLGLETGVRKAFTDNLDHLGGQDPLLVNPHDQDWYYYTGVSLSYTFYKVRCPDLYKNNKKLLQ